MSDELKELCYDFVKAYHHSKSDDKEKDKKCFSYDYGVLIRLVEKILEEAK